MNERQAEARQQVIAAEGREPLPGSAELLVFPPERLVDEAGNEVTVVVCYEWTGLRYEPFASLG